MIKVRVNDKKANVMARKIPFLVAFIFCLSCFFVHSTYKFDRVTEHIGSSEHITLKSGQILEQEITGFEEETLSAVNIMFGTYKRSNDGNINLALYRDGEVVERWSVLSSTLNDNQYKTFELDKPLALVSGSKYVLRYESIYQGANNIAVYIDSKADGSYRLDGEKEMNGAISYTLTYRNSGLKNQVLLTGLLISLVVAIAVLAGVHETIIMSVMLAMLLSCFMWLCPLGMAPDEGNHFFRAYEIAKGNLISQHLGESGVGGNYLPNAIMDYSNEEAVIDWDDVREISFGNTALYAPVSYLPQSIGIKVVELFTDNVSSIFYGGKFGSAIICYLLCVVSLCIIPFGKKIIFLLMTFPLTMQEMISMSPDGFTIALSIFFLSYILRVAYISEKVKMKDIVILGIVGINISLLKIVYVVLLLLILLIPGEKFKSKKQNILFKCGLMGIAGLLNLIWLKISFGYLVEFNPGVNSLDQVKYILFNIHEYYLIAVRTLIVNSSDWISNMISSAMGALNIGTTMIVWIGFVIVFVYQMCSCYTGNIQIRKYDVAVLAGTFLLGMALIFTSLYVQWTPLENNIIHGIQGRYFTPLLGCLAFSSILVRQKKINNRDVAASENEKGSYYYMILLLFNGMVLLDMINYYIIDLWR